MKQMRLWGDIRNIAASLFSQIILGVFMSLVCQHLSSYSKARNNVLLKLHILKSKLKIL